MCTWKGITYKVVCLVPYKQTWEKKVAEDIYVSSRFERIVIVFFLHFVFRLSFVGVLSIFHRLFQEVTVLWCQVKAKLKR